MLIGMVPAHFTALVADAFNHLYDLVYLRTHRLADFVTPDAQVSHKKKAWLLHDVLLGVIEELDPGYHAPADGREKRRYRLLSMRYSEGCASKAVADALAISLRHYYREHDTAIEAVAAILWQRYGEKQATSDFAPSPLANASLDATETLIVEEQPNRQAMLRAEAAHFHNSGQETRLNEILLGVVELAQEMARAKGIHLTLEAPPDAVPLPVERTMVRQILLGVLSYLGEQLAEGSIVVRARLHEQVQIVEMIGAGKLTPESTTPHRADQHSTDQYRTDQHRTDQHREEQIATLHELASLQSIQLESLPERVKGANREIGFALRLPCAPRRTVLLVDDNSDILELYQRYLQHRYYRSVSVQNGRDALQLAIRLQPQAIVLDLMLPEQDGWEILQRLTNHPATQSIPVVICSILRARQLALALGAAAFLEKPVDEVEFVRVLDALTASQRVQS